MDEGQGGAVADAGQVATVPGRAAVHRASERRALRVAIILPERPLAPGMAEAARRLEDWLSSDPRMILAELRYGPSARIGPGTLATLARIERSLFGPRLGAVDHQTGQVAAVPRSPPSGSGPLDVAVDLTGQRISGWTGAPPRHGVWRLTALDPGAGLAAALDGRTLTEIALVRDEPGGARTLATARLGRKLPALRHAAFLAEKSALLVIRALADLHTSGVVTPPPKERALAPKPPLATARYAGRLALWAGRRAATGFGHRLGLNPGGFALRLCPGGPLDFDPGRGRTLPLPRGHFWADPFLFDHSGATYLFYEDFSHATNRGTIAVARLEGDRPIPLGTALEADYHLSFPYVFAARGAIWMMPETCRAGRLEVYRAVEFPLRWERVATAFEGAPPVDCVLADIDGAWWLFANRSGDSFGDYSSELHLFRVDGPLLHRIEPHPLNPVVFDSSTARGGGRVWRAGGRLYRASQDNSGDLYGGGLNVMEITRIDMEGYAERRVRHIAPDFQRGAIGCHHMDFAGGQVVIDVRYRFPHAVRD